MVLILLYALWIPAFATAHSEPYPFTSAADATRFNSLTREVRCVVCQSQSVADSNTPIADGIRRKIYQMILDKKSNSEIKDYLVKRYGEFILLDPRISSKTILLWGFPFIALVVAGLIIWRLFRKV